MNPTLSDIIWYLFIGGVFCMMIRNGGCCGGHRQKQKNAEKESKNITRS